MLHTILSVQLGKALSSELGAFLYAKCAIIPEEMHSNLQSVPIVDSSVHLVHNQVHLLKLPSGNIFVLSVEM
jgi:hypothetical protein